METEVSEQLKKHSCKNHEHHKLAKQYAQLNLKMRTEMDEDKDD